MSKPSFEQAINELERTVERLEDGDLNLEDSLKDFERGIKIQAYCKKTLDEFNLQLDLLLEAEKIPPLNPPKAPQQSPPLDLSSDLFDLD